MTIASPVARVTYAGSGSAGPFAIPFRFFSFDDLDVIVRDALGVETLLVEDVGFTGAGERNASGTLTLTNALAVGESLTIVRRASLTQESSFRNQGAYFGSAHEDALDALVMQMQALSDRLDRSIALPTSYDPNNYDVGIIPETGKVLGWASGSALTNLTLDSSAVGLPGEERTVATLTAYLANNSVYNAKDYGAVNDGDASKATANSTAIQKASDKAQAQGGGTVFLPGSRGTPAAYCVNAPVRFRAGVSVVGDGRYPTIVKKTTATASSLTDTTAPVYQFPTQVGNPVCVFHFAESAGVGTSYAIVRDITVQGNTTDPNTTVVDYGFFFNGMSNCWVVDNLAQYCKVGFFWGNAATIASTISGNRANWCHRGFYQ
jgi:hypothetical protein